MKTSKTWMRRIARLTCLLAACDGTSLTEESTDPTGSGETTGDSDPDESSGDDSCVGECGPTSSAADTGEATGTSTDGGSAETTSDATTSDATTSDATTSDATTSDATTTDATTTDATTTDATTSDATTTDATTTDATTSDATTSDATTTGATTSDATTTDATLEGGEVGGTSSTGEPEQNPPVAAADVLYVAQDVLLQVAAPGVLANDSDPDGDALTVIDAPAVSQRGGTLSLAADGSLEYDAPAGFWGTDTFEYTITDGVFQASAEVTVHVAPVEVELSTFASPLHGFRIDGQSPGEEASGTTTAIAGDVDGDGLADVIVGAPYADGGFDQDIGRAYVVFGTTAHDPIGLDAVAGGTGGFEIVGENGGDQAGWSVAAAGDVNDDGLADVIVGAPFTDQAGSSSGRAYVVFGKADTSSVSLADIVAGQGGFAIDGGSFSGWLGTSVSAAGDIDGDGLDDVVVGAPYVDVDGFAQGRTFVVFGKVDGDLVQSNDLLLGSGGFAIDGGAVGDSAGVSVSGGGDVNDDGVPDVVIGAPSAGTQGRAYVVFGGDGFTTVELSDVEAGNGGFAIVGEAANDQIGHAVAGAGDVDGDGLDDLVLGTPWTADHGMLTGRAYVVLGKADGTSVGLVAVRAGNGGFAMIGELSIDQAGHVVAGAGDVDGDGLSDVLIGSYGAGPGGQQRGRAYVVYGGYEGAQIELGSVGSNGVGFIIDGDNVGGLAGSAVGGGGDVDGDGVDDVVVGAPYELGLAGRSYVVPGVRTDPE